MNQARALSALCLLGMGALVGACSGGDETRIEGDASRSVAPLSAGLPYRGVALAGAEFGVDPYGNGPLPGAFGVNYMYPDAAYVSGYTSPDYFVSKGMTVFRLPFRWERVQPARNQPFDGAELGRLKKTVDDLTQKGVSVILDPHNYARYGKSLIGSPEVPNADFADLWTRLAQEFKGNPKVIFGLMNEPHDMPTEQWASAAQAAISAVRATGATNLVLVPGNGWTGAGGWSSNWYGTPNATVMLGIADPGNNFAFEAHQYVDADGGGGNPTCVSATVGSERMKPFTDWLRANKRRGFLGELGASASATCLAALTDQVKHVEQNSDVYLGWTYWAGGPWWGQNWMAIEPTGGKDAAQLTALLPFLSGSTPPPPPAPTPTSSGGGACQAASYDAASMTHSLGSPTAGGWNLWSNGYAQKTVSFAGGATTLTVSAKGSVALGGWPHMVVSIDGAAVGNTNVSTPDWADYAFTVSPAAGAHEVRVAFDNDLCTSTEDRNLYLEKIAVGCGAGGASLPPPPPPPPPPSSCQATKVAATAMTPSVGGSTPGGWNLWSNGYLSSTQTLSPGSTITVDAKGSIAAGVWPQMTVSVGGTAVGTVAVSSTEWKAYSFPYNGAGGSQTIHVAFDNDFCTTTEDRNLYVEDVVLSCGGAAPSPSACVPATCAAAGKTCGALPDGCGASLACGTCAAPETCGGGGVANVCAVPAGNPPPPPPPPPPGGAIKIMPLGDSITLGVNGGYRDGLWTRLGAAGKSIDFVGSQVDQYTKVTDHDHEGHPGFNIGNISSNANGWLASATPSYVLLMIGTNDVAWWTTQSGSQIADAHAALVDQILADLPTAWVVVASIPPLTSKIIQPNNVDRAQLGKDYNVEIQKRAEARIALGKRVRFADVAAVLTTSDLYDGVHPTEVAHDKVAQVWFDALTPILPLRSEGRWPPRLDVAAAGCSAASSRGGGRGIPRSR